MQFSTGNGEELEEPVFGGSGGSSTVVMLDDDKLVLVINRFKQFYEGMVDKRNY